MAAPPQFNNQGNLQIAANCACNYLATDGTCNQLKLPPDGYTMSGWVKVTFKAGGQVITVGNKSAPGLNHHACIKDFEFGHANGCECRVNIHDEQGSSFVSFMENILKNMDDANAVKGTNMVVEYGWVTTNCDDGATVNVRKSEPFYFMMREINCNFAGGKFMYQITGVDITEVAFESRINVVYGGDDPANQVTITEALTRLFTDPSTPPVVKSVRFLKREKCGAAPTEVELERSDGDPRRGIKGKWVCNDLTKIAVAKEWLKNFVTKDKKALKPAYNSEVDGGEIIFWEDTKPNANEKITWENYSIGKYVVNGGQYSSVLEFNPKIKWNFSTLTGPGGGMSAGQPTANTLTAGSNPGLLSQLVGLAVGQVQQQGVFGLVRNLVAGSQTTVSPSANLVNVVGPANAGPISQETQAIQMRAFSIFYQPIEAELVVLGDETVTKPSLCLFRNLHIVFIDPYFIFESKTENAPDANWGDLDDQIDCGDWLSRPICNPVLSNKAWLIRNITHRIQDGKFTTTYSVYLAAPGVDLPTNAPLGGRGSCGWQPVWQVTQK